MKFKNVFQGRKNATDGETFPKKNNKGKKKWIIVGIIVLLVIALLFVMRSCGAKKVENVINTAMAERGDISVIISGTGTIEANEQYNITSLVKGTVLQANFEEGQQVREDDVLYVIDAEDMENSIEKSKNALERSQLTYNQTKESIENLNIFANVSGVVTEKFVKKGDNVQNGGKIATITDNAVMVLQIPFNSSDIPNISVGDSAQVVLENTSYPLTGTVSRIASGYSISDEGVSVTSVRIDVENPGAIKAGDKATAVVGTVACNNSGVFEYNEQMTILAKTAGEVAWIDFEVGDKVVAGQKIVQLESDSIINQQKSNELSLRDAQLSINNLYTQMEDYTITSPISGTVIKKTTKAGDKLDNTTAQQAMAIVADMSKILFKINVDELDIAKIQVGQMVSVTADALPDKAFTGYVDYVSIVGSTTNGVTTYPVTVVVNEPEGLIPGMNVDADIVVESKSNVLQIPVSALKRGNIVTVKDGSSVKTEGKEFENVPEGFRNVKVQVGLNNKDKVEIISGLNEGDEVIVVEAQTRSLTDMMNGMMGGGMPPHGGGGMR